MGIPSYFSYIVKNHSTIIKRLSNLGKRPHNLYLDSNSIIYDCLRRLTPEYSKYTDGEFETKLIDAMCVTIDGYIKTTNPSKTVFIAFDGVAPFAKMDQQKNRRYKSALDAQIKRGLNIPSPKVWDKTAITPGTKFMKKWEQSSIVTIKQRHKHSVSNT
jgi:5'-3' exoribonuclease 1